MSEFTCANGHLMGFGQIICERCGARLESMDGFSERELELIENDDFYGCDDDKDYSDDEE